MHLMKCGPGVKSGVRRKQQQSDLSGKDRSSGSGGTREVYFELYPVGDSMKVSAVDAATGTEVSIVGPVTLPQSELEQVALNKLNYVLARDAGDEKPSPLDREPSDDGKGWVV